MPIAIKSIKQPLVPTSPLPELMETFRHMVNDCIKIGLQHDAYSRNTFSKLAYKRLATYDIISYYKLGAISHAAGILANRRKSIRRGLRPRQPYAKRPLLISCYGIKIVSEG